MHGIAVVAGVVIVCMIIIHIIFRMIKFTFSVFFLGVALIAALFIFKQYLGVDLVGMVTGIHEG